MSKRFLQLAAPWLLIAALVTGCGSPSTQAIKVGSKDFTEALLLAEMHALLLEEAGFKVERKFNLGGGEQVMSGLGARSKLDTTWPFLVRLKELGRACAERWLAESFEQLGEKSTLDLTAWLK